MGNIMSSLYFTRSLLLCGVFFLGSAVLFVSCDSTIPKNTVNKTEEAQPTFSILQNQLGFSLYSAKSAVVRLERDSSSTKSISASGHFEVVQQDKVVLSGELKSFDEFAEWNTLGGTQPTTHDYRYFKADYSALTQAGHFQLAIYIGNQKQLGSEFEIADNIEFSRTAESVIHYFTQNRFTDEKDKSIRVFDSQRRVNAWGGWMDAGGDTGKYLSHLSYANFMNPQQGALVTWALAKSYRHMPAQYRAQHLESDVIAETFWGADYLHRILDKEGYFYLTVFDGWGSGAERMVTGYVGLEGTYTKDYQAAFREGGGIAIAALASAAKLASEQNKHGEFTAQQYLAGAKRAFTFLQKNNRRFCDNGRENIIDDYTALIAANELYRATKDSFYLDAARIRAQHLNKRITPEGWFISDGDLGLNEPLGQRPFYHGVEAGLPLIALVDYVQLETDASRQESAKQTLRSALNYQVKITQAVSNPFGYARQTFKTFKDGKYGETTSGFFMPHANETLYWWQGESARLASLTAATIWAARLVDPQTNSAFSVSKPVGEFAQQQIDWILGRNPYNMSQLFGFGTQNPPFAESAGARVKGGISNGITGATNSDEGRGITWAEGPEENDWRWVEQWIPHSTWFLLAMTAMNEDPNGSDVSRTSLEKGK